MTLPATDSFTTGSTQLITSYSANWSAGISTLTIYVNATSDNISCEDGGSGWNSYAYWNADTFNNNQYSQIKCSTVGISNECGAAVRMTYHANGNCYFYRWTNNDTSMWKVVSGTYTQLGSGGAAGVLSSVYRLEANGTTITPKKDGVTADIGAQTDEAIGSGSAGVMGCDNTGANYAYGDDWEGGDIESGGTTLSVEISPTSGTARATGVRLYTP